MTPSITCPKCGMTSYHPDDIKNKYCGNCHQFHSDMEAGTVVNWILRVANGVAGISLAKLAAWIVVIIGWMLYGLILIIPFINPHPRSPMEDFQLLMHPKRGDIIAIPIMIAFIIGWYMCWEYIKERNNNKQETKHDKPNNGGTDPIDDTRLGDRND